MNYKYTNEWFEMNRRDWEEFLPAYSQNKINAIEIGSYEGRSTIWLLENLLLNPESHIHCIDTFQGSIEHKLGNANMKAVENLFDYNIKLSGKENQVTKHSGKSQELLRTLPLNSFDFVYVDGSHEAKDILEDAILSWRLLKKGGVMIFDDYPWRLTDESILNPKTAIDAFMYIFQEEMRKVFVRYSVMIVKIV